MQPKIIRSLFFMLLLNLVIKPVWLLGIDRTVQNITGTAEYGVYYALFSLGFYLQIILDPGLHTFNNRSIAQNQDKLQDYFSAFLPLKFFLSILYIVGTLVLGFVFGFDKGQIQLLGWIALNQALASFVLYLRSNFAGLFLFYTDSIFSVLDRTLMIIICAALIWGNILEGAFKIQYFVFAQTAATAFTLFIALWISIKKSNFFKPNLNLKLTRKILKQSYPFAILTILMTLYTRIDSLMLERLLPSQGMETTTGAYQAGIYAAAYRLLDAAGMVAFLFASILLPVFSNLIAKKESVVPTIRMAVRLLYIPAILLVLASFFYRHELMDNLYNASTEFTASVFGLLMIGFLALCNVYIFGSLLTANGNLQFLNWTSALGVFANIVINLFLIFKMGALGAVIATLITQGLVSILQVFKAHRIFNITYTQKEILQYGSFLLFAVLTFLFLHDILKSWIINVIALMAINFIFVFLIGLIRPSFISTFLKLKLNDSLPAERE